MAAPRLPRRRLDRRPKSLLDLHLCHLSELSERERRVLEAVIQSYVETAEPAGSRTISRRFGLGVSPATIRNTMSELEEKGYLFHPHTSAGRIPTDSAYRLYVDSLMGPATLTHKETERLAEEISGGGSAIEAILRRAAQSLSVVTQELGVALGPRLDRTMLQRLELVRASEERLLLVLTLSGGAVRTIFVEVPGQIAETALAEVSLVLNERLERAHAARDPVVALVATAGYRRATGHPRAPQHLRAGGRPPVRPADCRRPTRTSCSGRRRCWPSSRSSRARTACGACSPSRIRGNTSPRYCDAASTEPGISITIGAEHGDPRLDEFTVVTAEYRTGALSGVIGVIGPTRMPYDKVIALVRHTSQLVSDLLD